MNKSSVTLTKNHKGIHRTANVFHLLPGLVTGCLNETKGGNLKEHCHSDFAVVWSKLSKLFTKNLFSNMKLLLKHWEENIKRFLQEKNKL